MLEELRLWILFSFPTSPKPSQDEDSFQQAVLARGEESECSDTQAACSRVTSSHTSAAPPGSIRCMLLACRKRGVAGAEVICQLALAAGMACSLLAPLPEDTCAMA